MDGLQVSADAVFEQERALYQEREKELIREVALQRAINSELSKMIETLKKGGEEDGGQGE